MARGGMCDTGACMARGCVAGGGMHAWQERWPLQQTYVSYWNSFLFQQQVWISAVIAIPFQKMTKKSEDYIASNWSKKFKHFKFFRKVLSIS